MDIKERNEKYKQVSSKILDMWLDGEVGGNRALSMMAACFDDLFFAGEDNENQDI